VIDALMAAAAAEVVFHAFDDLLTREFRVFKQHRVCVHDHSGRAKTTLHGAVFDKRALQRMKLISFCQALDGCDAFVLDIYSQS
jgi:hypothetical protein